MHQQTNIFELLENKKNTFTKNDMKVYSLIKHIPEKIANNTTLEVINSIGISQAAYTRFAQKLGFSGISDFQYQYTQDYLSAADNKTKLTKAEIYGRVLKTEESSMDMDLIDSIADRIISSRHTYVTGFNLSKIPAEHLSLSGKALLGKIAFVNCDESMRHFDSNTVLIIYSTMHGEFYKNLLSNYNKNIAKPYIILITMNHKHILKKYADEVVLLPTATSNELGASPIADTLSFIMFNDILMDSISKKIKNH